jgi:hypothetical protein
MKLRRKSSAKVTKLMKVAVHPPNQSEPCPIPCTVVTRPLSESRAPETQTIHCFTRPQGSAAWIQTASRIGQIKDLVLVSENDPESSTCTF